MARETPVLAALDGIFCDASGSGCCMFMCTRFNATWLMVCALVLYSRVRVERLLTSDSPHNGPFRSPAGLRY